MKLQVGGRDTALSSAETCETEVDGRDSLVGKGRRQSQQVADAIYPDAVQRHQIVPEVAASDKDGRKTLGSGRDARPGHRKFDRIVLAHRAEHYPAKRCHIRPINARKMLFALPDVSFDGSRKGIAP